MLVAKVLSILKKREQNFTKFPLLLEKVNIQEFIREHFTELLQQEGWVARAISCLTLQQNSIIVKLLCKHQNVFQKEDEEEEEEESCLLAKCLHSNWNANGMQGCFIHLSCLLVVSLWVSQTCTIHFRENQEKEEERKLDLSTQFGGW